MVYSKYLRYIIDLFVKHISKKEVSFISHIMKQNDEIKSWNRLCVANLKFVFMDWMFLCFNNSDQVMLNLILKLSLLPRTQVVCLKNGKFWQAPTSIKFNIFGWNLTHVSYLEISTKGCSRIFLFCLDLELSIKM